MAATDQPERRPIRSFVRRAGRITDAQRRALDECWPDYGLEIGGESSDLEKCFGNSNPVVLEIGFGDGELLIEMAERQPGTNFLGIEVHEPGIGHCLLEASRRGLDNVRLIRGDASEVLARAINGASLSGVNIFFPDPWPKKRHHKRRLIQPDFVRILGEKLKSGGLLHIATDWSDYAEHMESVVGAAQVFILIDRQRGERPTTKFEVRGTRLGHAIYDLRYRRA